MTEKEFRKLCSTTPTGTALAFRYNDIEVKGTFVGCAQDAVVVQANGRQFLWPRELCQIGKSSYPVPSYS